jgi:hypothetical protein
VALTIKRSKFLIVAEEQYIFLHPESLQLASMFKMRMYMRIYLSNASVFGPVYHKFTQLLNLYRTNEILIIHRSPIHVYFGISAFCVIKFSTQYVEGTDKNGLVKVFSNKNMYIINHIIRWIMNIKSFIRIYTFWIKVNYDSNN